MLHKLTSWLKERREWVLFFVLLGLLLLLVFQAGYLLGKQELSPIIIEKH